MFYGIMKLLLGTFLRVVFRPQAEGLEHIPAEGPAIIVSNHLSFSDSFFLPSMVDRKITFVAKAEYFNGRGLKGWLTAAFFRGIGQVPVDRSGSGAGDPAIRSAIRVLERGGLFGIYPEGTRSPDGRLYRGKPGGLAKVALTTGAPVIPVAMIDTEKIQPPGKLLPRLSMRPGIRIGKPLDFSRYQGMAEDRFILRSLTDEVMYEIMKLSGQEYVDVYAADAKREIEEARKKQHREKKEHREAGKHQEPDGDRPGPGSTASGDR